MSIATNLHGRLRNTSLPASSALLPLFEAVSNSIHAIEDAGLSSDQGTIIIQIKRTGQGNLDYGDSSKRSGPETKGDITGFVITDNGIGFNDENMESFLTLDSEYKADRGGRGVGRLLWLKAFSRVIIESVYDCSNGDRKKRSFTFDVKYGVSDPVVSDAKAEDRRTTVNLSGFVKRYREASPKTAEPIAKRLFEHLLWYFVRPRGAPNITILDDDDTVSLVRIYEDHMVGHASTEKVDIKGNVFELIHIKLSASSSRSHNIAFCAASRLVEEENIKGKIPGLFGSLHDEEGEFVYQCYVSSPLLDERVRSERTSFDIEEEPMEMFASQEVSQKEIRDAVIDRAAEYLREYLEENRQRGKERVAEFVAQKAPRYRPIVNRISKENLAVDPDISDKDLELFLHKQLAEIEEELLVEGHDVMNPRENEDVEEYKRRLHEYLRKAEDIKKSDLASYVSHRRVIIDLLEKAIQKQTDGKYAREDLIHNLIMPMQADSNGVKPDSCNLWLLDERLAFHDYLASDKTLSSMPITGSTETKEPDLLALNVYDNPILVSEGQNLPLASIVVFEIKRPMRNDAAGGEDKDPIEQALGYLDRIRRGEVKTASGRPIPNSDDIPGFCYAICDITPSVKKRCAILGLTPTHDHLGYFGYNPNFKAYLEVISFDRLVNAAKERNKAFFDKLGLPAT